MKEYRIEDRQGIDPSLLEADFIPTVVYAGIHRNSVVACHDVIIEYGSGALLLERKGHPFKGEIWPVGGRMRRGVGAEDSLCQKVREETGLELSDILFLGTARTLAASDPFGHGKGTDTLNLLYFAKGNGELVLDSTSKRAIVVSPADCTPEFRGRLHPYVQDFLDMAMPRIR
jgi:ADP-ribose pyrophosphatase YjhB (NUDIX family)